MTWLIWLAMMLSVGGAQVLRSPGLLLLAGFLLSVGLIVEAKRISA